MIVTIAAISGRTDVSAAGTSNLGDGIPSATCAEGVAPSLPPCEGGAWGGATPSA